MPKNDLNDLFNENPDLLDLDGLEPLGSEGPDASRIRGMVFRKMAGQAPERRVVMDPVTPSLMDLGDDDVKLFEDLEAEDAQKAEEQKQAEEEARKLEEARRLAEEQRRAKESEEDDDVRIYDPSEKHPPVRSADSDEDEDAEDEDEDAGDDGDDSEDDASDQDEDSEDDDVEEDDGDSDGESGEEEDEDDGEDKSTMEPLIRISHEPAPEEDEDDGSDEDLTVSDTPNRVTSFLGTSISGAVKIIREHRERKKLREAGLLPEEEKPRKQGDERKNTSQLADIPAKQLAAVYGSGLGGMTVRILIAILFTLLLSYVSLSDCLNLPTVAFFWDDFWAAAASLELLTVVVALLSDFFLKGFTDLFTGAPGMHTVISFAVLFTQLDCIWFMFIGREGPLPCAAAAAAGLCCSAWGQRANLSALRVSCRAIGSAEHPSRLVRQRDDEGRTDVLLNVPGTAEQFGSQIQETDGVQRVTGPVSIAVLVLGLILALWSAFSNGEPTLFLWCASVILTASAPLSATVAWALPFRRLARRLGTTGAAVAGWDGARELNGVEQVIITDTDLFPTGWINCNGIQTYGNISGEIIVGYCATLIRMAHSGLETTFDKLVFTQGARYWDDMLSSFLVYEAGGIGGTIGHDNILIGTEAFMRAMNVPLPEGISVKTAAFCSVNGDLAAQFALIYKMPAYVVPAFKTLLNNKVSVTMGVRDFNLTTMLLTRSYGVPMHELKMPTLDVRRLLSPSEQPEGSLLGALLGREGLDAHCDAVLGAKILVRIVHKNTRWVVAASLIGLAFSAYLTHAMAFASLQPCNILAFVLLWLIPPVLNSWQVDKY